MAVGLGAEVTIFDRSLPRLRALSDNFGASVATRFSTHDGLAAAVREADIVIGGRADPGGECPEAGIKSPAKRNEAWLWLLLMSLLIRAGVLKTATPTTHEQPTYIIDDVVSLLCSKYARGGSAYLLASAE